MKTLVLFGFIVCMGLTSGAEAQVAVPDPVDLVVLKYSWSKERIGWERDPFSAPAESYDQMRTRTRDERRLDTARRTGNIGEANKIERELRAEEVLKAREAQKTPPRYVFSYKVSVKNGGSKPIKAIDWDYIFFDASTQQELSRHQFTSEEKIAPGKTKELSIIFSKPPTRTVSVHSLGKNERAGLGEHIIIVRIVYADDTVWQRPQL